VDNSVIEGDGYSLKPESPLWTRPDFAPIPVDQIGLYSDSFRKLLQN
jgi:hypothetical protein